MKKGKIFFVCFYTLTALITLFNVVCNVWDSFDFSIDELPTGTEAYAITSPTEKRTLTVYRFRNALGDAVRAEVCEADGKPHNVYWQTGLSSVDSVWVSDEVVRINDVTINVARGGTYDCRRGQSIFREGALEGENVEAPNVAKP